MSEGIHTFTETGKMRRATHAEVCNWVVQAWKAVKVLSIKNGFRKAGIASGTDDDASQTSNISDNEQITSTAILDPVLDAQLMDLFNSDIGDEDFNGFRTELNLSFKFLTLALYNLTVQFSLYNFINKV